MIELIKRILKRTNEEEQIVKAIEKDDYRTLLRLLK